MKTLKTPLALCLALLLCLPALCMAEEAAEHRYLDIEDRGGGLFAVALDKEQTGITGTRVYTGYVWFDLDTRGTWGLIDALGHQVLPCEWDGIGDCTENWVIVEKDGAQGVIGYDGTVLLPFQYDELEHFSGDLFIAWQEDHCGIVNFQGEWVIPCEWHTIWPPTEGRALISKDGERGPTGYLNEQAEWVIPPEWDWSYGFHEGMASVKKYGLFGYIDWEGNEVIPPAWMQTMWFSEGLAWVRHGTR